MAQMHAAGIGTGVHYPAIHLFALYRRHGLEGRAISRTPNTPGATSSPSRSSPRWTGADVARVVDALADILEARREA